jgi:hypothetical protein
MAVTFPGAPANGQIVVDPTTGNRWQYQALVNSWLKLAPVVDVVKTEIFAPANAQVLFVLPQVPLDPADVCIHINGVQYFPPLITVAANIVTWGNLFLIAATDTVRVTYT